MVGRSWQKPSSSSTLVKRVDRKIPGNCAVIYVHIGRCYFDTCRNVANNLPCAKTLVYPKEFDINFFYERERSLLLLSREYICYLIGISLIEFIVFLCSFNLDTVQTY